MNIFIIGNGMYTTGRGTVGYGTILPAIIEFQRKTEEIHNIYLIGSNVKNSKLAKIKYQKISKLSKIKLNIKFFPLEKNNSNEYKKIIINNKNNKNSCAIISTPDHLHYKMSKFCIINNIHTLVVKPLTPILSEAKILTKLANKYNVYGAVEFHKRFDKQNILTKNKINNKNFGDILYNTVDYSQRKSIPTKIFKKWINKTNLLQYLGVHYVDLIYFLTNAIPTKIMVLGQKSYLNKSKKINSNDSLQCIIKWKSPKGYFFNQILFLNWVDPENTSAMSDQKFKIIFTNGRIEADQKNRGLEFINDTSNLEHPNPDFSYQFQDELNSNYWSGYGIDSITTFLRDCKNIFKKKITLNELALSRPTFKTSLVSCAVIEAGNKSLNNGSKWVKVNI